MIDEVKQALEKGRKIEALLVQSADIDLVTGRAVIKLKTAADIFRQSVRV